MSTLKRFLLATLFILSVYNICTVYAEIKVPIHALYDGHLDQIKFIGFTSKSPRLQFEKNIEQNINDIEQGRILLGYMSFAEDECQTEQGDAIVKANFSIRIEYPNNVKAIKVSRSFNTNDLRQGIQPDLHLTTLVLDDYL